MANVFQAAKIANAYVRPAATRLSTTYLLYGDLLKLAAAEDWQGIFAQFNQKDPFVDPDRPNDDRAPITPENIKAVITGMQTVVDFMDANPALRDLILAMASPNPVVV